MNRLLGVSLLLLLAAPAGASNFEVGADLGAYASLGHRPAPPAALVGATFAWRPAPAHAVGLGLRTVLPAGNLPAPRLQYAFDFDLGGLRATLPVAVGLSPQPFCGGDSCRPVAEARAGFGMQVFDAFLAPWVTLEVAAPLGVPSDRQTVMVGLHVAVRWEPLSEDFE